MKPIGLFWRTVRHLTPRQVVYQVVYRLRGRAVLRLPDGKPNTYTLTVPDADKPISYTNQTFTFLNQSVCFTDEIDWNYAKNGKLWTYNLNYFDFLNQPGMPVETGLELMQDFIRQTNKLGDGLDPYPTSLRIINWVQFLSRHDVQDTRISNHLFAQTQLLFHRLEYHLSGNHLLENGFALLIGSVCFRHSRWFKTAVKLIRQELKAQILADGGHDERSPMYHQLLLDRLLTVLLALQDDIWHDDITLIPFLTRKATAMLDWLRAVTFQNGDMPLVNDAAVGIAPATAQLLKKATAVIPLYGQKPAPLTVSGYRMFRPGAPDHFRYELFVDAGAVGPDHQPGHAHADTFSFVLYVDNRPVFVDSGTSTYEPGEIRNRERGTAAHNTVEVANANSSEVWATFRVGRRARVTLPTDTETTLTARHDGYRHLGIVHERSWQPKSASVQLIDRLIGNNGKTPAAASGIARFHVHPNWPIELLGNAVRIGPIKLSFGSVTWPKLYVTSYALADGFNRSQPAQCLNVLFTTYLETSMMLLDESAVPDVLF